MMAGIDEERRAEMLERLRPPPEVEERHRQQREAEAARIVAQDEAEARELLGRLTEDAGLRDQVVERLDRDLRELVYRLRCPGGGDPTHPTPPTTWAVIGKALGSSAQAAQQRFGAYVDERYAEDEAEWKRWMRGGGL